MSTYICPNCGHEDHIFGHGGAREEAEILGVPFLGEIPLNPHIRINSDDGVPIAASPSAPQDIRARYDAIAKQIMSSSKP